ncbi:MAG: class I SAM-dependent methyltransferase [Rickettsiales bacterium]|nr:class I SAM-dependent methyltransferase [Rickettsiales bacterium]
MQFDISKFTSRGEIVKLIKPNGIGLELGVAKGKFSEKLLEKSSLKKLYSIDAYAGDRGHDENEFLEAQSRLKKFGKRSEIIRAKFSDAVKNFPDEYFDFIYIDGYAHTGQDEGRTLYEWFPKLKIGGIFSGDDYSPKWQKNVEIIDEFANKFNLKLHIIKDWNSHHSWLVTKNKSLFYRNA